MSLRNALRGNARLGVMPEEHAKVVQTVDAVKSIKAEIRRMKRTFTIFINSDYYTGYMSALSAVEGYIAQLEGDAE